MCYEKAAEICQSKGYDIFYRDEKNNGQVALLSSSCSASAYTNNNYLYYNAGAGNLFEK